MQIFIFRSTIEGKVAEILRTTFASCSPCCYFYNTYDIDQRHFGVDAGMQSSPQTTYWSRVEIGGVYLPSQLERTLQLCM
jgi:hypothetical protein